MMKEETGLLLTLEPEQIYSSVRNVEKVATVISLHGNKFPVLFCGCWSQWAQRTSLVSSKYDNVLLPDLRVFGCQKYYQYIMR